MNMRKQTWKAAVSAAAICVATAYAIDNPLTTNYTLTADESVDGVLTIASGVVVDLAGHKLTARFPAKSASAATITSSVAGGELHVIVDDGDTFNNDNIAFRGALTVVKEGAGSLSLATVVEGNLVVKEGSATPKELAYSSYRFKVEAVKVEGNYMQFSEFALYDKGTDVTRPYASIAYDSTYDSDNGWNPQTFNSNQKPSSIVEGNLGTKWLDTRIISRRSDTDKARVWFQINYGAPKAITGYSWYTANDNEKCDPTAWRLQGSNNGGETWTDIDVQTNYVPTTTRKAQVGPFALRGLFGTSSRVFVHAGATLRVDGINVPLAAVENDGTVELLNDARIAVSGGCIRGTVSGTGSVEAADGSVTMYGNQAYSGETVVSGGTLNVGTEANPAPRAFDGKYYRLTFKRGVAASGVQLSEIQLYDSTGATQSVGLVEKSVGTAATALAAGSFAAANAYLSGSTQKAVNLFDGNTGTKMWCYNPNCNGSPSNHLAFVMHLSDDANPVASYNFYTANDREYDRSPIAWSLEGSRDGISWTLLDERWYSGYPSTHYTAYNGGVPYTLGMDAHPSFGGKFLRFTFTKTANGDTAANLQMSELMVFDMAGSNVAQGLVQGAEDAEAPDLAAGSFSLKDCIYNSQPGGNLFDANTGTKICGGYLPGDKPVVVLMRLRDDALPVGGYLFVTANDHLERSPGDWTVEGSVDGVNWTTLDVHEGVVRPTSYYAAMNEGHAFAFASIAEGASLPAGSEVQIAPGATMNLNDAAATVGALRVDCTLGGGTINSFRPAAEGTLALVNVPVAVASLDGYEVPVTVTDVQNAVNLAGWTVSVDGVKSSLRVKCRDGKIVLTKNKGLMIIVK